MNIDVKLESKDLIYAACVSAVNGIIERRKRRNFADDLDSIVSINLGRQTGHTDATIKLYDHYTRKAIVSLSFQRRGNMPKRSEIAVAVKM